MTNPLTIIGIIIFVVGGIMKIKVALALGVALIILGTFLG